MELTVVSACFVVILLASGIVRSELEDDNTILRQPTNDAILNKNSLVSHGSKLTGGSTAPWEQHTYVVAVMNRDAYMCGGVIVSEDSILTSQDTLLESGVVSEDLKVRAIDTEKRVLYIYMQDVKTSGALAMLKLESKFVFLQSRIAPLQLRVEDVSVDVKCTVMGLNAVSLAESVVRYADVPTIQNAECDDAYGKQLDNGFLCTGNYDNYTDICHPNTGDPLICDGLLTGVATKNNFCDNANLPGIYTNVAHHNSWIVEQMQNSSPPSTTTPTTTPVPTDSTTPSSATSNRLSHIALITVTLGVLFCNIYD